MESGIFGRMVVQAESTSTTLLDQSAKALYIVES